MATLMGLLRRKLLAPSLGEVAFSARGFPTNQTSVVEQLESIPQAVVCGFEWGIESRDLWEVERRLSLVNTEFRGFAYEGAAMAFTILDAMSGGRGSRTRDLLAGPGERHIFLAYIGIGFAMARLPRKLWQRVIPELASSPYHPTMSWLAVDGYAFDRAYFDTERWIDSQHVPAPYPWAGAPGYFHRAVDQGIGRALWFINAAQPPAVAAMVDRFAPHRRADLWSGVGLAATFAGGCDVESLVKLRVAAGEHFAEIALGSVLAAKARHYAGYVPQHAADAVDVLAELGVHDAVAIADSTAVTGSAALDGVESSAVPPYELWRQRIRAHLE